MWSRLFGGRNLPVPVEGQIPYESDFTDASNDFLNSQKYPWPSRETMDLLKLRLQPYLDAPCFAYSSTDMMLKTSDILLRLWALALSRLMSTGSTLNPKMHRALTTMILSIAQRDEFHIEFLGFRLPSRKKINVKRKRSTSGGPTARAAAAAASAATMKRRSNPYSPTKFKTPRNVHEKANSLGAVNTPRKHHTTLGGYYENSGPLPQMGTFDPKQKKQLSNGHEYCKLLGLTIVHVIRRMEDVESRTVATNIARRKSMSGVSDSPIRKSSSPALYHNHELRYFASVLVLGYFRAPELIVPLIVQGVRRALEDMGPDLLNISVAFDSTQREASNVDAWTSFSDRKSSNHGFVESNETQDNEVGMEKKPRSPDRGKDKSSVSSFASKGKGEVERWGGVCSAFKKMQRAAMCSPDARYNHSLFIACNPSLFSWKSFYTELSPELYEGLQRPFQWLKKLLSDGYFYSLFMSEFVEHIHHSVLTAPANAAMNSYDIAWEIIPGYFLLVKLFTCLLQQFYKEKLRLFVATSTLKLYGPGASALSANPRPSSPSISADSTKFRFRMDTTKALNTITQAAKDLIYNGALVRVWQNVCIGYTNVYQSRSVEMSMNQLDGWIQAIHDPVTSFRHMDMELLVDTVERLLDSQHHRILISVLSFIYRSSRRLFVGHNHIVNEHMLKLIGETLLSRNFFNLFLHWDQSVRAHFHHILVYRIFSQPRSHLGLEIDMDVIYLSLLAKDKDKYAIKRSQRRLDPDMAIQQANSLWCVGQKSENKGQLQAESAIEGRPKSNKLSLPEARNAIDDLDIDRIMSSSHGKESAVVEYESRDPSSSDGIREVRKLVMRDSELQEHEHNRPNDNDSVIMEIYSSMMRRMLNLVSENSTDASENFAKLRRKRDLLSDMDETIADTGGVPRGRAVYASASTAEYGTLLKHYYLNRTGFGPHTIVVDI